jgi:ribA/ribD-fused uncharacterized protein
MIIDRFTGEYRLLSNFSPHSVTLSDDGIEYPTLEHAFQAVRTHDAGERALIRETLSPTRARKLGQFVELRPRWDETRYAVMLELVRLKFITHPDALTGLLATGDATLIAGNDWHDNVWGNCTCLRRVCAAPGSNVLGRTLMKVRGELRAATRV